MLTLSPTAMASAPPEQWATISLPGRGPSGLGIGPVYMNENQMTREKLDALNAALLNSLASAALSFNDTHYQTVIHPTSPVGAALVSLATKRAISGKQLIAAVTLGAIFGAINGLLVASLRLPSIVVTLATMVTLRQGLNLVRQGEFVNLPDAVQWFGLSQRAGQWLLVVASGVFYAAFVPAYLLIILALIARIGVGGGTAPFGSATTTVMAS